VNFPRITPRGLYGFPLIFLGTYEDFAEKPMEHRSCIFRFADVEVDESNFSVTKSGEILPLEPKVFKVLQFLLHHPGRVVTKDELLDAVWNDCSVSESSLTRTVATLRRLLEDDIHKPCYIATVPTVGYRFLPEVHVSEDGFVPASARDAITELPVELASATQPLRPEEKSRPGPKRTLAILAACGASVLLAGAAWLVIKKWHTSIPASPAQRGLTRLTFDDGLQIGATWSPDARYIAYSSDRGGKFDIWVQQVSGGNPVQITRGSGHHWQPDWSPNGKYIAYRSEEGDGGIYVAPALGGAGLERKIAPFGYYPKWSPDSSQVLFQTHFTALNDCNRFYVAQLDGTPPHEVLTEWIAQNKLCGASAAWYPDAKKITIWGGTSSPTPAFWTVPLAGGPGIKMEIASAIQRELAEASGEAKASQQFGEYSFSWSPLGDAIYFERAYRGAKNIWKMTVDHGTLGATRIERLTTGPGADVALAVSSDGRRLAFTAKSQRIQTWLFPFDARTGQLKGHGNPVTSPGRTSIEPNLSRDGTKIAYFVPHGESYGPSFGDVRNEVWVKSLVDGSEVPIPADGYSSWFPLWSPDGAELIYSRRSLNANKEQLMLWSSQSHEEEPLTGVTQRHIYDWSTDGKWLSVANSGEIWLISFPSSSHAQTTARKVTSNPAYMLYQPHLSPDDRWIVFEAVVNSPNPESALYVVPASGGPWIRITDGRHWDDKPRWSPDGRTIYFVSGPGGFFNVWGRHFDRASGKPIGQPFPVSHFDSPRLMILRMIPAVGLSLTQDKLVMTMAEESGNIWILDNVDR
jgi:Tol biopolymer transport system component/DNA-binding winged helix-turn-helix (wHTH) protein